MNIEGHWINRENGSTMSIKNLKNESLNYSDDFKIEFFDKVSNTALCDEKVLIVLKGENIFSLFSTTFGDDFTYILFRNSNEIVLCFPDRKIVFNRAL